MPRQLFRCLGHGAVFNDPSMLLSFSTIEGNYIEFTICIIMMSNTDNNNSTCARDKDVNGSDRSDTSNYLVSFGRRKIMLQDS